MLLKGSRIKGSIIVEIQIRFSEQIDSYGIIRVYEMARYWVESILRMKEMSTLQ